MRRRPPRSKRTDTLVPYTTLFRSPAWWITGQALDLLLALAHFIASRPGSMAMLPVFPEWTFALVVFGGLWISLWRSGAQRTAIQLSPEDRKRTRLNSSH